MYVEFVTSLASFLLITREEKDRRKRKAILSTFI